MHPHPHRRNRDRGDRLSPGSGGLRNPRPPGGCAGPGFLGNFFTEGSKASKDGARSSRPGDCGGEGEWAHARTHKGSLSPWLERTRQPLVGIVEVDRKSAGNSQLTYAVLFAGTAKTPENSQISAQDCCRQFHSFAGELRWERRAVMAGSPNSSARRGKLKDDLALTFKLRVGAHAQSMADT